jgi:hypothetical protein
MILYCKDSLGCIDNNNIELINNMSHCGYLYIYEDPTSNLQFYGLGSSGTSCMYQLDLAFVVVQD